MADTRHKNGNWVVADKRTGEVHGWPSAQVAVLMDIRDELQEANRELRQIRQNTSPLVCTNAIDIPNILRRIEKNTKPKRRKRAPKK